jgi:hypothetical protein
VSLNPRVVSRYRKWQTAPYVALALQFVLVVMIAVGFLVLVDAQRRDFKAHEEVSQCVLVELENHRSRAEDVYGAFALGDPEALADVLAAPPPKSSCLDEVQEEEES